MLKLPADLTHDSTPQFLRSLPAHVSANGSVVVDASALTNFDSSAIATLLECRRQALAGGKHFSMQGLSDQFRQLAALYGVEKLLS